MTDTTSKQVGLSEPAAKAGEGKVACSQPKKRRLSAQRKQEAVLRLLRGEDLDLVSRDLEVTAADLSAWQQAFLDAGAASLKSRPEDDRDQQIKALTHKVGEITMANELLEQKIDKLEAGTPFRLRRSKR